MSIFKLIYFPDQTLHMSSIYHEIRTPLNGIVCASEIITEEISNNKKLKKLMEWLELIRFSSNTLSEIIENMVSFSQVIK